METKKKKMNEIYSKLSGALGVKVVKLSNVNG